MIYLDVDKCTSRRNLCESCCIELPQDKSLIRCFIRTNFGQNETNLFEKVNQVITVSNLSPSFLASVFLSLSLPYYPHSS